MKVSFKKIQIQPQCFRAVPEQPEAFGAYLQRVARNNKSTVVFPAEGVQL